MITTSRRSAVGLTAATLLALGLTGCASSELPSAVAEEAAGTETAAPAEWVTPRELPAGWGSGVDDGVFPRTVVHPLGETEVAAEPERVVVISTGQMDAALTLGVVPVGSTAGDGADMVPAYLLDAFPEEADALDAVTFVGSRTEPDIEAVADLEPDLILMNTAGKDADALYAALAAVAPTVATQGTGLYWKQDFQLLADALGQRQAAQSWLAEYQEEAAELGAGLDEVPEVSFLRTSGDRTRVFGVASFSGSVAEDAGLARPEAQSFTDETSVDISAEQIDLAEGDWLFYGVQGGDETELTSNPLWPTLQVVVEGHEVEVDDDVFYLNTGPTAARSVLDVLEETLS